MKNQCFRGSRSNAPHSMQQARSSARGLVLLARRCSTSEAHSALHRPYMARKSACRPKKKRWSSPSLVDRHLMSHFQLQRVSSPLLLTARKSWVAWCPPAEFLPLSTGLLRKCCFPGSLTAWRTGCW